jgi:stage V sporulation protein B
LALSTIFMMLQQTASGALQGMGRIWLSVRNMLIGVVVKIGLTWWLAGIPSLQERGAALATVSCFVVAASLQLWALREHMGFTLNLRQEALRPLTASALMGVAIWATSSLLHRVLPSPRIAGVLVIGLGGLVYLVALMAMGGLTMADLKVIPGMPAGLADWLQRKRLLRD